MSSSPNAEERASTADDVALPPRGLTRWSGEWIAFWTSTATLYVSLLWLYWPSLTFQAISLQDQPRLAALARLPLRDAFAHGAVGPSRPGETLLFWLVAHSDQLMSWRAGLLVVFLITTAFVQYYATERCGSWMAGLAAAACFSLSPTSASVVCWLSAANIGLCALALMVYVECSHRLLERVSSKPARAACLSGALLGLTFALALYELAVLAPLLMASYHRWLTPRRRDGFIHGLYVGSAACVAGYLAWQLSVADAAHWWAGESAWQLTANAARYAVSNFLLWLWPWGRFGVSIPDPAADYAVEGALCWLLLLASFALLWKMRRRDPVSVWGFAWFFLFLVPAGALRFRTAPVAQEHLYLPMLGFVFAGARVTFYLLERLSTNIAKRPLRLVVDGVVSVLFFWTFAPLIAEAARAVELWGDEERLYLATIENYPESAEVLGRLTERYLARTPRIAPIGERGAWDALLDALLMRPTREPAAALIRHGRELVAHARYVEAGSAFARALEAGASGEEHFEAGRTLVHALLHTDQRASAAALLERLRREYPERPELDSAEL